MSYGADENEQWQRAAMIVARSSRARSRPMFRWSNPRASTWRSNLRTAKALGLTIPQSLLVRADQVIQ